MEWFNRFLNGIKDRAGRKRGIRGRGGRSKGSATGKGEGRRAPRPLNPPPSRKPHTLAGAKLREGRQRKASYAEWKPPPSFSCAVDFLRTAHAFANARKESNGSAHLAARGARRAPAMRKQPDESSARNSRTRRDAAPRTSAPRPSRAACSCARKEGAPNDAQPRKGAREPRPRGCIRNDQAL